MPAGDGLGDWLADHAAAAPAAILGGATVDSAASVQTEPDASAGAAPLLRASPLPAPVAGAEQAGNAADGAEVGTQIEKGIYGAPATSGMEVELAGPPEPPPAPPPPPLVLFPDRLGEFPPVAAATAAQGEGQPAEAPPVMVSQVPHEDLAGQSVWRLGYSGRAAYEERSGSASACSGGGTLSSGIGAGVVCRSTGEVKMKESLFSLDGGPAVEFVAQARGTEAMSVNGRPAAVDPYQLLPQFYTAVSGLAVLDGATMWAGRRDSSQFLMSSGLLPPQSPAMRFGVDNARFGEYGLSYQYTARNDTNGQNLPSYHSLRSTPIKTNDKGALHVGFTRVEPLPLTADAGSAWWASAMHEQKGVLAGTNRFGVQYGSGSRVAMTGYSGMGESLSRVRFAESMEWQGRNGLGGAVESSMQFDRSAVGTLQWMATRLRPAYKASDQFKLTFEVAHDQISSGFGASGQRTAVTVAPTFTLGKAAGNANLRAFYTYSKANDVEGISFAAPADAWASQASGSVFGVQLNRRW